MGNGRELFDEVQEIMATGDIPQHVSNRLLMASVLTLREIAQTNRRLIDMNRDMIEELKLSDKRWAAATAFFAALLAAAAGLLR